MAGADASAPVRLETLATPALLVDLARFDRNLERMQAALSRAGGAVLRPHLKTVKSVEAARRIPGPTGGPVAVSTAARSGDIRQRR